MSGGTLTTFSNISDTSAMFEMKWKEGFIFYSCDTEDYVLLKELEDNNKKIIILPYIKYFVKNIKHNNNFLHTNERKFKKIVIKKEKKLIYSKK